MSRGVELISENEREKAHQMIIRMNYCPITVTPIFFGWRFVILSNQIHIVLIIK
jgi:hypothetical protein